MNGKNHNAAFSLIETVIATAVLGIIVTSVYTLLQVSIEGDARGAARVQRILLLKNALSDPELFKSNGGKQRDAAPASHEIIIKDPKTRIIVTQGAVQGALATYKHLIQAQAQAKWEWLWSKEQEQLTLYHCEVPAIQKPEQGN